MHNQGGRVTALLLATTAMMLSACSDKRLDSLAKDIQRDSALKVLAGGQTGDSLANVYKQETYLYNGQMINVLLYSKDGTKESDDPAVPDSKLTPVVTVGGKVTGWG